MCVGGYVMIPKEIEPVLEYYQPLFKSPIEVYITASKTHTGSLRCNLRLKTISNSPLIDETSIDVLRTESILDHYKLADLKASEIVVGGCIIMDGDIETLKDYTKLRVVDLDAKSNRC
jgi:hypothetical protein